MGTDRSAKISARLSSSLESARRYLACAVHILDGLSAREFSRKVCNVHHDRLLESGNMHDSSEPMGDSEGELNL